MPDDIIKNGEIIGKLIGIYTTYPWTSGTYYAKDQNGKHIIIWSSGHRTAVAINIITHEYKEVYEIHGIYLLCVQSRSIHIQSHIEDLLKSIVDTI